MNQAFSEDVNAAAQRVEPERHRFELTRIVDGDTLYGLAVMESSTRVFGNIRQSHDVKTRLLNVDTPETTGAERPQGLVATEVVRQWLESSMGADGTYAVDFYVPDNFGRWLVEIFAHDGSSLNEMLNLEYGWPSNYSAMDQIMMAMSGRVF